MGLMRDVVSLGLLVLAAAGCASAPEVEPQAANPTPRVTTQVFPEPGTPVEAVQPVDTVRGRILSVNPKLRFVIADFPTRNLPHLDQKLGVWRMDHKVAEIKVSGPYRGTTVAADITAGEVKPGDMVRQEW